MKCLTKRQLDSWRKYWGTDDDDIPDPPHQTRGDQIVIIDSRLLRAAAVLPMSDKSRTPKGVLIECTDKGAFVVATNGTCLFAARTATLAPAGSVFIPTDLIKQVRPESLVCDVEWAPGEISINLRKNPVLKKEMCPPPALDHWRNAVPKEVSGEPGDYNPAQVALLGKVAKILTGRTSGVRLSQNGARGDALAFFEGCDVIAVIAPLKVDDADHRPLVAPLWATTDFWYADAEYQGGTFPVTDGGEK